MSAFSVPMPATKCVRVNARSGRVSVRCERREDVAVVSGPGRGDVSIDDEGVRVSGGSSAVELAVPEGVDLFIGSLSGSVEVTGAAGAVNVSTASGHINVDRASTAELRSLSGHISLNACAGGCRIATKSGRAKAGEVGTTEVATLSGNVNVDRASGNVRVKSVSGRVEVGCDGPRDVEVKTMSGSVKVTMPGEVRPGVRIRTVSGKHSNEFARGDDCHVSVATISGRVDVVPG